MSRTHGPELDDLAVLAADTTVDVDGEILAKPADDDDARRMLRRLSGRTHRVHTAVLGWTVDAEHATTVSTDAGNNTTGRTRYTPTYAANAHQAMSTLSMNRWAASVALRSFDVW